MGSRLDALDANKNGVLEPNEVEGRTRFMVEGMARNAGLDTSKPIPLDKLKEAMRQRMQRGPGGPPPGENRDNNNSTPAPSNSAKVVVQPTVLAFGGGSTTLKAPLGFGKAIDGPSMEELAKKYDREVMGRVTEKFRENDKNKNGLLESEEWPGLSSRSNPKDWDKNKDGILTREEVAEHYASYSRGGDSRGGPPGGGFFGGPFGGGPPGGGSSGSSSSSSSSNSNPDSKIQSYADSLLKQYDDNKDGVLQEAEWSKMRSEHHAADKNGDKLITKQELFDRLASSGRGSGGSGGGSNYSSRGSSKPSDRKSYRALTPIERLPKGLPTWFTRDDANEDGQVSMAEYATAWSDAKAAEFVKYDTNGDGVITSKECLAGEKSSSSK